MQVFPLTSRTQISSPPVQALNRVAERLLAVDDARRAFAALTESLGLEPTNARTHYLAGLALGQVGAIDPAERELESSLRYFPDSPEALSALGQLARRQGNDQKAARFLSRAVAADPLNIEALTSLIEVTARLPEGEKDLPGLRVRLQSATAARAAAPLSN